MKSIIHLTPSSAPLKSTVHPDSSKLIPHLFRPAGELVLLFRRRWGRCGIKQKNCPLYFPLQELLMEILEAIALKEYLRGAGKWLSQVPFV